jgi:hypothetical protein
MKMEKKTLIAGAIISDFSKGVLSAAQDRIANTFWINVQENSQSEIKFSKVQLIQQIRLQKSYLKKCTDCCS